MCSDFIDGADATPWPDPMTVPPSSMTMAAGTLQTPLEAPSKKDAQGRDKATAVKKRELEEFKLGLWRQSWNGARTTPSSAAPVPNEAQARCPHRFEDLLWSSNQHGHWARCKRCDLKHVLYHSERRGVLVTSHSLTTPLTCATASSEALVTAPPVPPGQVILDSGCRTAVAGQFWHEAFQAKLVQMGVRGGKWRRMRPSSLEVVSLRSVAGLVVASLLTWSESVKLKEMRRHALDWLDPRTWLGGRWSSTLRTRRFRSLEGRLSCV